MLFSVQIKWLQGSHVTLPNDHDKVYWMGDEVVTFFKNVYTVAMAFTTKIVVIQWLPLTKRWFLMKGIVHGTTGSQTRMDVATWVNNTMDEEGGGIIQNA